MVPFQRNDHLDLASFGRGHSVLRVLVVEIALRPATWAEKRTGTTVKGAVVPVLVHTLSAGPRE